MNKNQFNLENLGRRPETGRMRRKDIDKDPFSQFKKWFNAAHELDPEGCTTMTLSTVNRIGKPSSRTVLLKGLEENRFSFFTNYESKKAKELGVNPHACILFYWPGLARQVRIEGVLQRLTNQENDQYFKTRPRGSQIGAWVSEQSSPVESREVLDMRKSELTAKFEGQVIPRPPQWGGYCLIPEYFEFWQGSEDRLHDRFTYKIKDDLDWEIVRLFP